MEETETAKVEAWEVIAGEFVFCYKRRKWCFCGYQVLLEKKPKRNNFVIHVFLFLWFIMVFEF
jgi:hypothetical protein